MALFKQCPIFFCTSVWIIARHKTCPIHIGTLWTAQDFKRETVSRKIHYLLFRAKAGYAVFICVNQVAHLPHTTKHRCISCEEQKRSVSFTRGQKKKSWITKNPQTSGFWVQYAFSRTSCDSAVVFGTYQLQLLLVELVTMTCGGAQVCCALNFFFYQQTFDDL